MEDKEGNWHTEDLKVEEIFCEYFHDIFTSRNSALSEISLAVDVIPKTITIETNSALFVPFAAKEVHSALL